MRVGLVGKPNVGKSTFFAAATMSEAEIGNYPFTTIDANRGVAAVRVPDPGPELGVQSTPRSGRVVGATRYVPVELIDVAGLVPGAHEGRGLGNKFLGELARADVLIHVIDATGATDAEGNPGDAGRHDPLQDVAFLENEIDAWIDGILHDGWERVARRVQQENRKIEDALVERLAGLGVGPSHAAMALRDADLAGLKPADWPDDGVTRLARAIRKQSKPIIIALNKADLVGPDVIERLKAAIDGPCVPVAAQVELALRKGADAGALTYAPGDATFAPAEGLSQAQQDGLAFMQSHVFDPYGSTGVQELLETAFLEFLDLIPVYPVEDDHHFTDKKGLVLPDCHLVPRGTTARELAYRVHTDLGDNFVRGLDCRTRRTVGADHALQAGDVIRIAANA